MTQFPLPEVLINRAVTNALAEDLGDGGDITTLATIPATQVMTATLRSRKDGVIAGADIARAAFLAVDPTLEVNIFKADGAIVKPKDKVMTITGTARGILTGERVALNFMGHLSGIATATYDLVKEVKGTDTKIVCTRKTTPGLRAFEKHAVKCGGGHNHRFGLYDAVMIKDNHIASAGNIAKALQAAKSYCGHTVKIEIEVDTLGQLDEVLAEGADIILLDNMSPDQLREAVVRTKGRAILEASGNITKDTVRVVAQSGVDVISSGWITHSAPTLDLGLDIM